MPCSASPNRAVFPRYPTSKPILHPWKEKPKAWSWPMPASPYIGIGVLTEPVRAEIEKGLVTKIEGGMQARKLADDLAGRNDPLVYNVAELGVGLNPKAAFKGIMTEDEGVCGTAHIGIGTNLTLGGTIKVGHPL